MNSNLIAVVDDECICRTTKLLTESVGYRAVVFGSGEIFLRPDPRHDTSSLIVDIHMPGINGLELQSQLAAQGCTTPIIFITAYGNKDTRRRAMLAGAVAFLDKPFSNAQLLETIRSALQLDTETRQTSDSSV